MYELFVIGIYDDLDRPFCVCFKHGRKVEQSQQGFAGVEGENRSHGYRSGLKYIN